MDNVLYSGGVPIVLQWYYNMRNKHYKVYQFRLSDELIKTLKQKKNKDKLSWNLFFKKLIEEEWGVARVVKRDSL